jgi:hypothetical protein
MLYILNTRRALRLTENSNGLGNSANNPSSNNRSRNLNRATWRAGGPVELSSLGGVHVHTETDHDYGVSPHHILANVGAFWLTLRLQSQFDSKRDVILEESDRSLDGKREIQV